MIETPSAVWMSDVLARSTRRSSRSAPTTSRSTRSRWIATTSASRTCTSRSSPRCCAAFVTASRQAKRQSRWVGVCGEMAGDPHNAVLLLGSAWTSSACRASTCRASRRRCARVSFADARKLAEEALALPSAAAVKALLRERLDGLLPEVAVAEAEAVGAIPGRDRAARAATRDARGEGLARAAVRRRRSRRDAAHASRRRPRISTRRWRAARPPAGARRRRRRAGSRSAPWAARRSRPI